jgi:hypothetical protein
MSIYRIEGSEKRHQACLCTDIKAETKQEAIEKFKAFYRQYNEWKEPKKIKVREI